jgi:hypothetical protein
MMPRGGAAITMRYESQWGITELGRAAAEDLIAGRSPTLVARESGMSVRTAYRWRAQLVGIESVCVGGWVATFAIRRGKPPSRISAWERA